MLIVFSFSDIKIAEAEEEKAEETPAPLLEIEEIEDIHGVLQDGSAPGEKLVLLNEELCVGEVFLEGDLSADDHRPRHDDENDDDDDDDASDLARSLEPHPSRRTSRSGASSSAPRAARYVLPNKRREVGERGRREKVFECPGE